VQDLEVYVAYKAEVTMQRVDKCLRVIEETRETASRTLVTVRQQGQQSRHTHAMALDIDQVIKIIFFLAEPP
jgi:hypothetical protein